MGGHRCTHIHRPRLEFEPRTLHGLTIATQQTTLTYTVLYSTILDTGELKIKSAVILKPTCINIPLNKRWESALWPQELFDYRSKIVKSRAKSRKKKSLSQRKCGAQCNINFETRHHFWSFTEKSVMLWSENKRQGDSISQYLKRGNILVVNRNLASVLKRQCMFFCFVRKLSITHFDQCNKSILDHITRVCIVCQY